MASVKSREYIRDLESKFLRNDLPELKTGQKIKVWTKYKEKDKEREVPFEGIVISVRGSGTNKTFTVRNTTSGVQVDRIFPYHSPYIVRIEILQDSPRKKAKLYHQQF